MNKQAFMEKHGLVQPNEGAVQLKAVGQNGYSILYIKNPSEAVQLKAVGQDGYSIQYIENPSEAVMSAAIKQNKESFKFFKDEWFK